MKKNYSVEFKRPLVVATAHSAAGLKIATGLAPSDVDLVEVRVDALLGRLGLLRRLLPTLKLPILLTVRHPAEGGIGGLTLPQRKDLFAEFLPYAALVDVELRSAKALSDVIVAAKARGAVVVLSDHHFAATPLLRSMCERERRAFLAGADVFKIATATEEPRMLARLLEFSATAPRGPRAVMGMGKFGQVSRLSLARAGSVLNYGYLDKPNALGQWEARELKTLFARLGL